MNIHEFGDNLVNLVGGEDAFLDMMAEIADECQRKMGINDIRNFYKNTGNDGCSLESDYCGFVYNRINRSLEN